MEPALPDALLASKKRSSSNNSAAPTIATTPTGGDGDAKGRSRDSNGTGGGSSGERGRGSRASSGNKSDGSSAGSPRNTLWSKIDWEDLNGYTVRASWSFYLFWKWWSQTIFVEEGVGGEWRGSALFRRARLSMVWYPWV